MFCVLSTLDAVPIITCPRGVTAEKVASLLDQQLRDHFQLKNKDILFSLNGKRRLHPTPMPSLSLRRASAEFSLITKVRPMVESKEFSKEIK
jgi:hypothetical protein